MFYCLSRYTFVHPLLRYRQLLHLLQLFGNCKCCFLDRIAAEMLIGLTTNRWKWNEWGKHPNICWHVLIHVVMTTKHFVTIRFMGENILKKSPPEITSALCVKLLPGSFVTQCTAFVHWNLNARYEHLYDLKIINSWRFFFLKQKRSTIGQAIWNLFSYYLFPKKRFFNSVINSWEKSCFESFIQNETHVSVLAETYMNAINCLF